MSDASPKHQNRLAQEKSPYLLQHADNPVDWHPWGEAAFQKAKQENKPIFLSIGYSTCHWCHVMEHESFEDEKVAARINEYFVPIKVDREERPDIDNIYMAAVTSMTGRGGWPLTVFLTHDKKPFFGGTYFPPYAKWGAAGLMDLMENIHHSWMNDRQRLIESSNSITSMLQGSGAEEKGNLDARVVENAARQFVRLYDKKFGGFGQAPKFPQSHNLSFLLRYWKKTKDISVLQMVEHTLEKMAKGGVYDHLGGGFHRYATDQQWQIPHFEKMLYDQAILARTYLEAYQITHNEYYATVAREIFDYVLRDLTHAEGGFFSAEDADSLDPDEYAQMSIDSTQKLEKKEGSFYLWRYEEIVELFGEEVEIFNYHFGIEKNGNAHSDPHGEFTGKNIVFVDKSLKETAQKFKKTPQEVQDVIAKAKKVIFDKRLERPRPHLDDKVLVDWNGLMISSFAFGGKVLKEPKYLEAAERSTRFIMKRLITDKGRLLHRYRDQDAAILGMIEDYAFFIHGLIDVYEGTLDVTYLQEALSLANDMVDLFWDKQGGGFFFTANDAQELLFRQKEAYDGAIPSGNSMAAYGLVRLFHITLDEKWERYLEKTFQTFSQEISRRPMAYTQMLMAFNYIAEPSQEIVISQKKIDTNVQQMHQAVFEYFLPSRVILWNDTKELKGIAPFTEHQLPQKGRTTAYVCENHVCKLPVMDVSELHKMLKEL